MFEMLREADTERRAGNERDAAIRAIWAVVVFILRFEITLFRDVHQPLADLASALMRLDEGCIEPMLETRRKGGRVPDKPERQSLIGAAVRTVRRLVLTGMPLGQALQAVAKVLDKIGVQPSRGSRLLSARTIREWCERVNADVSGRGTAAFEPRRCDCGVAGTARRVQDLSVRRLTTAA